MLDSDIDDRFSYHPPLDDQAAQMHQLIRELTRNLAHSLNARLPDGREKALAMTKLEEVMFWSNAALARNQVPEVI